MRQGISFLMTAVVLVALAAPAEARHPHCWGGGCGYGGFGGGFYSNTCYAGFNSPFVYGNYGYGNCGYGCVPYRGCYYPGTYYGGYPAYNTFYYNSYPYGYGVVGNGPIFAPAQAIYGPGAVRNFLGMAEPTAPAPAAVRPLTLKSSAVVVKKLTEPRKVREASPEYRRKADQFIAQGDMLFHEQKYQQAVDRYKSAAEMAPDSAEAYWHKGHAYAATNRYELAASCFRRALTLNPDIARGGFGLDKLYGDTRMAKEAHLEAIAGYCLEHPDTADAYFVLGVFLHYNGEADRAEKFFTRAAELAGPDATYLARFVPGVVPVKKDELEL
ncbi:MAG: tetratricopeptide repeat protein [Pirellulaceae bacterium]